MDAEHDEQYSKPINRYGHLMSFHVKGGAKATRDVFDAHVRIWRATDLGGLKSVDANYKKLKEMLSKYLLSSFKFIQKKSRPG